MDIREKVRTFMLKEFQESGFQSSIRDDESLISSSILDSLSILKLISFLDEQFDIVPQENELNPDTFDTIEHITEFIKNKYGARK